MPKLLIIYDVDGWAYHHRAAALKKWRPWHWEVYLTKVADLRRTDIDCSDVVLLLDYANRSTVTAMVQSTSAKYVMSFNADIGRRTDWWDSCCEAADHIIAVNWDRYVNKGSASHVTYIPNGYDHEIFNVQQPLESRDNKILWCGHKSARKVKRYDEVVLPLKNALETKYRDQFTCDFRLIEKPEDMLTPEQQATWYNGGAYILCASVSEGTANTVTEAVACGCVPISTPVGNLLDWLGGS